MKTITTKKMPIRRHRTHDEATVESFRRDPRFAAAYLNAVLEEGNRSELMTALRYVTDAFGGVSEIAQKTGLNSTTLYRTLSANGNPALNSFMAIMKAVGMRILVEPLRTARR
jgi:probable addiction module antidote protein